MVREKIEGIPNEVSLHVEKYILDLNLSSDVREPVAEGAFVTLKLFNIDLEDPDSQEAIQTTVETWARFVLKNLDGSHDVERVRQAVADEIRWMYLGPSAIQDRLEKMMESFK